MQQRKKRFLADSVSGGVKSSVVVFSAYRHTNFLLMCSMDAYCSDVLPWVFFIALEKLDNCRHTVQINVDSLDNFMLTLANRTLFQSHLKPTCEVTRCFFRRNIWETEDESLNLCFHLFIRNNCDNRAI